MEARQTACGRLVSPTNAPQGPEQPVGDTPQANSSAVRRRSAAVACRRYASVLVYQLLHSGGAEVGVRFLQHAAMLVQEGDVVDQLFVVQVGVVMISTNSQHSCRSA